MACGGKKKGGRRKQMDLEYINIKLFSNDTKTIKEVQRMANEQNLRPSEYKLTLEEQKKRGQEIGRGKASTQNV